MTKGVLRVNGMKHPDMPLGLTMALAEDLEAMQTFSNLSTHEQSCVVNYIQGAMTGEEAKARIETAVDKLHKHLSFF